MWARACLRVPEARQHRFIHHRNEERTAGVEKCGEKLEMSRVLDAVLAGSGRHGPAEPTEFLVFRTASDCPLQTDLGHNSQPQEVT